VFAAYALTIPLRLLLHLVGSWFGMMILVPGARGKAAACSYSSCTMQFVSTTVKVLIWVASPDYGSTLCCTLTLFQFLSNSSF